MCMWTQIFDQVLAGVGITDVGDGIFILAVARAVLQGEMAGSSTPTGKGELYLLIAHRPCSKNEGSLTGRRLDGASGVYATTRRLTSRRTRISTYTRSWLHFHGGERSIRSLVPISIRDEIAILVTRIGDEACVAKARIRSPDTLILVARVCATCRPRERCTPSLNGPTRRVYPRIGIGAIIHREGHTRRGRRPVEIAQRSTSRRIIYRDTHRVGGSRTCVSVAADRRYSMRTITDARRIPSDRIGRTRVLSSSQCRPIDLKLHPVESQEVCRCRL